MQATTAEKAVTKSSPDISITNVSATMVMKYKKMNASTENTMRLGSTCPPMRSGVTACGCTSTNISRSDCLISTSVRYILMPPPVEPVLAHRQLRNSIHIGAKTGHNA